MEYLVESSTRWDNGSFFRIMSFDDIVSLFCDGEEDADVDEMIGELAELEVKQSHTHEFFMDDVYTFKRII